MDIIDCNVNIMRKRIKDAVSLGSFEDVKKHLTSRLVAKVVPFAVRLCWIWGLEDGCEPISAINGNGRREVSSNQAEIVNEVAFHIDHIIAYELDILIWLDYCPWIYDAYEASLLCWNEFTEADDSIREDVSYKHP